MAGTSDELSDCLHCEVNELVRQRVEAEGADVADLAAMLVQSLVELILLAPEADQAALMADVLASFGQIYLEKTGAVETGASTATH
jgi:hypothetical protein